MATLVKIPLKEAGVPIVIAHNVTEEEAGRAVYALNNFFDVTYVLINPTQVKWYADAPGGYSWELAEYEPISLPG